MRVAILTTSYPEGPFDPSGHFVEAEALAWAQRQAEVHVIAPETGASMTEEHARRGPSGRSAGTPDRSHPVTVHRLAASALGCASPFGWPGFAARLREQPLRLFGAVPWVGGAARVLRSVRPDVVVAHWAVPCAWPVLAFAGGRGVVTPAKAANVVDVVSHGGDVRLLLALPAPARRSVVRAIARTCSAWRFVSAPLRDALADSLDEATRATLLERARIEPCPLVLPDTAHLARLRDRLRDKLRDKLRDGPGADGLGQADAPRYVVAVGRLVASKRVDRILEFAAAHARMPLVVVGDGPERTRLEASARARKVDARFLGTCPRDEALAWLAGADALLFASEAEGLSTVVREAEALGVPVVRLDGEATPRWPPPRKAASRAGGVGATPSVEARS
jgi:glycosyltransferase involved in cell wall biosynthesis